MNKVDLWHYPKKRELKNHMRELGAIFIVALLMTIVATKHFIENYITEITILALVIGLASCIFIGLYFLEYWFPYTFVRREHLSFSPLKEYVKWVKNRVSLKTYLISTVRGSIILYMSAIVVLTIVFVFITFKYDPNYLSFLLPILILVLLCRMLNDIKTYRLLCLDCFDEEVLKQIAEERG